MKRALEEVGNNDYFEFRRFISGIRLLAYSDSRSSPASASFIFHFTAEFPPLGGKPVFLVDKKWYMLNPSFVDDLKFECIQTIKNHKLPEKILDIPWDKSKTKKESEYNLKYQDRDNYIVLDTFTPDGIEICDVLHIAKDRIYLIHVKYGFDASLRELSNQITLSSRRVYEDVKSGNFKYIDAIHTYAKDRTELSKDEFRQLFQEKIVYVFAFASQLAEAPLVEDKIERYSSNIAKYSLIQCSKDMQTSNYELNIHQIRRY